MLTIYSKDSAPQLWQPGEQVRSSAAILWLDLVDPNDAERDKAAELLGASLPTREQISALELSNRLRSDHQMLRMNVPAFVRDEHGRGETTPLAFVLSPQLLVCIRYSESAAFDATAKSLRSKDPPTTSVEVFVDLVEDIVNVDADRMEAVAKDLSKLARSVFSDTKDHSSQLRSALFKVGAMQREIIQIRSTQLGVSRMLTYLGDSEHTWLGQAADADLKMTHKDVDALAEFDQQLSDRLEFLLNAVLGFINNDQNDSMKVLTIITVVTIPPMILAGIWGMNFKHIPEYDWVHGYAFGLGMILLSMLIPLLILKWKKVVLTHCPNAAQRSPMQEECWVLGSDRVVDLAHVLFAHAIAIDAQLRSQRVQRVRKVDRNAHERSRIARQIHSADADLQLACRRKLKIDLRPAPVTASAKVDAPPVIFRSERVLYDGA